MKTTWKEILVQLSQTVRKSLRMRTVPCGIKNKMAADKDARLLDVEFVEGAAEEWECPICKQTLLDPLLLSCCGNHFCETCVKRLKEKPCPLCNQPKFDALLDKGRQRQVLQAKVHCPNTNNGCKWQGELRNLIQHLVGRPDGDSPHAAPPSCLYEPLPCPNEGCTQSILRLNLETHINEQCLYRRLKCEYCNDVEMTYKMLSDTHWPECPDFPVACPNNCGVEEMRRSQVQSHCDRDCKMQTVRCPFWEVGCNIRRHRKNLPAHVKTSEQHHSQLLVNKTVEIQSKQEELVTKLAAEIQKVTVAMQVQQRDDVIRKLDEEATQRAGEFQKFVKDTDVRFSELKTEFDAKLTEKDHQIEAISLSFQALTEENGKMKGAIIEMKERGEEKISKMKEQVMAKQTEEFTKLDEELAQVITTTATIQTELGMEQKHTRTLESGMEEMRGEITKHVEEMKADIMKQVKETKQELIPQRENAAVELAALKVEILDGVEKQREKQLDKKLLALRESQQEEHDTARKAVMLQVVETRKETRENLTNKIDEVEEERKEEMIKLEGELERLRQDLGTEVKRIMNEVNYIEMAATPIPQFSFTVSRFSKRREKKESFVSEPFYTHRRGYRMVVRVDSAGTDTHVSVWCCITRGQHDAHLKWPLRADIFIRLLNQKNQTEFYERQISYDHQAFTKHAGRVMTGDKNYLWGLREFITLKEVQNGHYLIGDALDFVVDRVEFKDELQENVE